MLRSLGILTLVVCTACPVVCATHHLPSGSLHAPYGLCTIRDRLALAFQYGPPQQTSARFEKRRQAFALQIQIEHRLTAGQAQVRVAVQFFPPPQGTAGQALTPLPPTAAENLSGKCADTY